MQTKKPLIPRVALAHFWPCDQRAQFALRWQIWFFFCNSEQCNCMLYHLGEMRHFSVRVDAFRFVECKDLCAISSSLLKDTQNCHTKDYTQRERHTTEWFIRVRCIVVYRNRPLSHLNMLYRHHHHHHCNRFAISSISIWTVWCNNKSNSMFISLLSFIRRTKITSKITYFAELFFFVFSYPNYEAN